MEGTEGGVGSAGGLGSEGREGVLGSFGSEGTCGGLTCNHLRTSACNYSQNRFHFCGSVLYAHMALSCL